MTGTYGFYLSSMMYCEIQGTGLVFVLLHG